MLGCFGWDDVFGIVLEQCCVQCGFKIGNVFVDYGFGQVQLCGGGGYCVQFQNGQKGFKVVQFVLYGQKIGFVNCLCQCWLFVCVEYKVCCCVGGENVGGG